MLILTSPVEKAHSVSSILDTDTSDPEVPIFDVVKSGSSTTTLCNSCTSSRCDPFNNPLCEMLQSSCQFFQMRVLGYSKFQASCKTFHSSTPGNIPNAFDRNFRIQKH